MKLVAIDVGNTNIKLVLVNLSNDQVIKKITVPTQKKVSSEYKKKVTDRISQDLIETNSRKEVKDVFLISVVPELNNLLKEIFWKLLAKKIIVFKPSMIGLDDNKPCGHDLIALGFGAMKISSSFVIVSMGTATVFITSWRNVPQGVVIAPGLKVSEKILIQNKPSLKETKNYRFSNGLFTKNDQEAAKIGIILGHVGMIRYIVKKISTKLNNKVPVLITGGDSFYLQEYLDVNQDKNNWWWVIDGVDLQNCHDDNRLIMWLPDLIVTGILRIYRINQSRLMSLIIKTITFFIKLKTQISLKWQKIRNKEEVTN